MKAGRRLLLISTALTCIGVPLGLNGAQSAVVSSEKAPHRTVEWETFFLSQYNYCDAHMIAELWNVSIDQAKVAIGSKIIARRDDMIEERLHESRLGGNYCSWADTGYTYDDAVDLARIWQLQSTDEAKAYIAKKLTYGLGDLVDQALKDAG